MSSALCTSLVTWEWWLGLLVERQPDWKAKQDPPVQKSKTAHVSVLSADAPLGECSFPGALLQAEAGGWWQSCLPSQALL